jgi:hypothetical protein
MTLDEFATLSRAVFADAPLPKPFDVIASLADERAARVDVPAIGPALLRRLAAHRAAADPVASAFGVTLGHPDSKAEQRVRKGELVLAQLLIGVIAEQAFEAIYRERLAGSEFNLTDHRADRNDTDYRVLNGGGRPLFRINSKFHGSLFRRAQELVTLDPADCFPLATYKIWGATQKEREENLPYLFLVISSPISAAAVADSIPAAARELVGWVHRAERLAGKRAIEERVVAWLVERHANFAPRVAGWRSELARSPWWVLSAQKADRLLRERLFERVYAVRLRGFNQQFRNAEVDMHFSLSRDMTPLADVLDILANEGSQGVVGRCSRAVI